MSESLPQTQFGSQFVDPSDEIVPLSEWGSSEDRYRLTDRDQSVLDSEVNAEKTRLRVEFDSDGRAQFHARQFAGLVALPDGPTIQITPKAAGNNLFYLLRYAQGASPTTIEQRTDYRTGDSFIDALAALFANELESVLDHGIDKGYRRVQEARSQVRGRIDLQRQLRQQGPTPTAFECRYNDLTTDTLANQTVLYAGTVLRTLVRDRALRRQLRWHTDRLRRTVTLRRVSADALDRIELTRLNNYYEDILRLAELVLRNVHVDDLELGGRDSFSLLVNMNTVFERTIERAVKDACADFGELTVVPQAKTTNLVHGTPTVRLYPDFIVQNDADEEVVLVGDAKWKTGSISNEDIYQVTAYSTAYDAPGYLVYPAQDDSLATEYDIERGHSLTVVELATDSEAETFETFVSVLEESITENLQLESSENSAPRADTQVDAGIEDG